MSIEKEDLKKNVYQKLYKICELENMTGGINNSTVVTFL